MIGIIIAAVVALIIGGLAGYAVFRYVATGKYKELLAAAEKEAEVIKEKKLLEVLQKTKPIFAPIGQFGSASKCPIVFFSRGQRTHPQEFPE